MARITIATIDSAAALDRGVWARLCPAHHPFLNADFFTTLERHGAAGREWGWVPRHLVATETDGDAARIVGLLPLYVKFNSFGDFIHDWPWASAYKQLGREYYPKLLSGIPHTPAAGPRFLVADGGDPETIRDALIEAAKALVAEFALSSWHVALPAAAEIERLRSAGLLLSQDVQFHWLDRGCGDFDGFLASFAADKRRKVRAERRRVADSGLVIETRHGDEIDPDEWPALHRLYAATFDKFANHAVFTAACFADLAASLGRLMVVFIARDRGEPVAVSLCFRSDEALYGRYWGCRGNYHSLHFELCFYQGIAYCLREGLGRFEPGAGGEHKIGRGFTPTLVRSVHWAADPAMRAMIARHLERERDAVAAYRDDAADHLPFRRA